MANQSNRDQVSDISSDLGVIDRSNQSIVPVILSGGSGSRLWPVSRELRPKQFLALVGKRTLFQDTVRRVRSLGPVVSPPLVVCNAAHRFLVAEQLRELGEIAQAIVLEPAARNTAPAVAVAALLAIRLASARAGNETVDPLLLVLPADHVVLDDAAFAAAVELAVPAAADAGRLVTFGVPADKPETGYGYLLRGAARGAWSVLDRFVEKPDLATAQSYVESGRYLWNSGMFLFSARIFLRELAVYEPAILAACEQAVAFAEADADFTRLGTSFLACASQSVDYAVMERTTEAAVVTLAAGWSDVGSWPALHEVLDKDDDGNVTIGDVLIHACTNSYIASNGRLVAAIGLDGMIIVETDDAVLAVAKEHAQDVKRIVDMLKNR
jgi:mannose-1-phosphate guanylyltransferase/mannose-6-phosphate isomerase